MSFLACLIWFGASGHMAGRAFDAWQDRRRAYACLCALASIAAVGAAIRVGLET